MYKETKNTIIIIVGFVLIAVVLGVIILRPTPDAELVGEGIVTEMRIDSKTNLVVTIRDKDYRVLSDEYYAVDVGDNVQIWWVPGSTHSTVIINQEAGT